MVALCEFVMSGAPSAARQEPHNGSGMLCAGMQVGMYTLFVAELYAWFVVGERRITHWPMQHVPACMVSGNTTNDMLHITCQSAGTRSLRTWHCAHGADMHLGVCRRDCGAGFHLWGVQILMMLITAH